MGLDSGEQVTIRQDGTLPMPTAGQSIGATCEPGDILVFGGDGARVRP